MRILGIDPGTRLCGYGVVEMPRAGVRPRYIECGVLSLHQARSLPARLLQLEGDLSEIIEEFAPDEMALESIFHGVNAQSALRLGYARGVVMLLSARASMPLHEYPPATVKRAVAGHGRASKQEVQRMVMWQCGLRRQPPADAADAVAVALCHAFQQGVGRAPRRGSEVRS